MPNTPISSTSVSSLGRATSWTIEGSGGVCVHGRSDNINDVEGSGGVVIIGGETWFSYESNPQRDFYRSFNFGDLVYVRTTTYPFHHFLTTITGFDGDTYHTSIGSYPKAILFNESEYADIMNRGIRSLSQKISYRVNEILSAPDIPDPTEGELIVGEESETNYDVVETEIRRKLEETKNIPPVAPHISRMYRY